MTHCARLPALAALLLLSGCPAPPTATPPSPPKTTAPPQLKVQVRGCDVYYAEGDCRLGAERGLQVWVKVSPPAKPAIKSAGVSPPAAVKGGYLFKVTVPPEQSTLTVESGAARWRLRLRPPWNPPWLVQVKARMKAKKYDEALSTLAPILEAQDGEAYATALAYKGRILGRQGNRAAMITGLKASRAENLRQGRVSQVMKDSSALSYMLTKSGHRLGEARETLATAPDTGAAYEAFASYNYASSQLLLHTGDLRTALRMSTALADATGRFDDQRMYFNAQIMRSNTLNLLGQFTAAETTLQTLMKTSPKAADPCNRQYLLTNIGWGRIIQLEAGDKGLENPLPLFVEAAEIARTTCKLGYTNDEANNRINIALAALHTGDLSRAKEEAIGLRRLDQKLDAYLYGWARDLDARIAAIEGRHDDALEVFLTLERWAEGHSNPAVLWRAVVGQADARRALGDPEAALAGYTRAAKMARSSVLAIGLGEGRASFLASRRRATAAHVALLVSLGRPHEAERVVRGHRREALLATWRTRRIAALDPETRVRWSRLIGRYHQGRGELERKTRESWRLPADQRRSALEEHETAARRLRNVLDQAHALVKRIPTTREAAFREPAPGELLVTYFRGAETDYVFARSAAGFEAVPLPPWSPEDDPPQLAAALLRPIARSIDTHASVRFLVSGPFAAVDLHGLPWRDGPLIAHKAVVYSADLPPDPDPDPDPVGGEGVRLIVTDPRGDLPASRRESAALTAALGRGEQRTLTLSGEAALAGRVLQALPTATHFHYAGHAAFGGAQGLDSTLLLADETRLGVVDILALDRVPATVSLLGCETGKSATAAVSSFSLANAFLLSGSRRVIAATRPITDATASFVSARLYDEAGHLAARRAQKAAAAAEGFDDWGHLRVFVR